MTAGQKVTYDCVWFGSYPQAEVVPENEEYTKAMGTLECHFIQLCRKLLLVTPLARRESYGTVDVDYDDWVYG